MQGPNEFEEPSPICRGIRCSPEMMRAYCTSVEHYVETSRRPGGRVVVEQDDEAQWVQERKAYALQRSRMFKKMEKRRVRERQKEQRRRAREERRTSQYAKQVARARRLPPPMEISTIKMRAEIEAARTETTLSPEPVPVLGERTTRKDHRHH
mmetsp:Transcript_8332/g.16985  ORF Transcript_8332/g.16985 Transcript_8332/m.16985 type:complete len:153 (-) Transcript_8332:501-959(-)|eukprot:CAMPEP_0184689426 /NCGR_PEP_ID=MMETSP0312-20130426/30648_1 /TAXON_ID=31354 /ORGANISM="Compsopogon coeruleus, Strain SAG 36.94" /LENGTH=152 /DNA_ID=CAMNT_0027146769 /DNA_START=185 /DNA_END=643 /DNA_ORIENTATION=+